MWLLCPTEHPVEKEDRGLRAPGLSLAAHWYHIGGCERPLNCATNAMAFNNCRVMARSAFDVST
jgi:hypothetical protein